MQIRKAVVVGTLLVILAIVNWQIAAKERVLREGELLLLELVPVDPRSLIQGDYMRLDYGIARDLEAHEAWPRDGQIVVANDADGIARFVRRYEPGGPLGAAEHLLHYRRRSGRVRIGTDAFFFQEGQADRYFGARYGEMRVDATGESLLIGLRDRARQPLGAAGAANTPPADLPR
jgi:uncharacterized membrane-anchored protein